MSGSDAAPRRPRRAAPAALALALAATAGCYVYNPVVTREPPAPGQDVRISYQEPGATDAAPWLRAEPRAFSIHGRVIEWGADTVVLGVFPPPTAAGMSRASPRPDTVRVPARGIVAVEERAFSASRTAALAVGGSVAGAFLLRALIRWTRRAGNSGGAS